MPQICVVTEAAAPPDVCFNAALDVDAHMASTSSTGERAVAGVMHGRMSLGDEVTWEARHLGVKQRLTSRIAVHEPPHRFVDEMVRGAFASFRHEHLFVPAGRGTVIVDLFDYRSPLAIIGRLADSLFLRRYMERLLRTRAYFLIRYVEATHGEYSGGVEMASKRVLTPSFHGARR